MSNPTSRAELIDWCKRRLGEPVIEVNVDDDQCDDRVDEAMQYYREYHDDGTYRTYLKHQVTQTDIDNGYITIPDGTHFVIKLFKVSSTLFSRNMFSIKYQMHLNDIANMHSYLGDLAYYEQIQQYLGLLEMQLNGSPQIEFVREQLRLYIFGEFENKDILEGDYIVMEAHVVVDNSTFTKVWKDMWLKEYTAALIKQQWGSNLIKFDGMTMPGGVTLNGRQIYDDAVSEIQMLREKIRSDHELPVDFFVG
tara:strand:- start:3401 stop:4153 length:753 start_codon:yes stop_codon:yes gene_type:complete